MDKVRRYMPHFVIFGLGFFLLTICLPFFSAIVLAGVFAFALHPFKVKYLNRKLGISKVLSVYLVVGSLLLCSLPFFLSFVQMFQEVKDYLEANPAPKIIEKSLNSVTHLASAVPYLKSEKVKVQLDQMGVKLFQTIGEKALELSSAMVFEIPGFIMFLFFFTASLFYFLTDSQDIYSFFAKTKFIEANFLNKLIKELQSASQSTLFAALITGTVQALIITITALILGLDFIVLIFFMTLFFSQIPVIGTAPITLVLSVIQYAQGNHFACYVILITGLLAGFVDNLVRPIALSRTDKLHPLLGLISSLGGIVLLGPIGVVLGPIAALLFSNLSTTNIIE